METEYRAVPGAPRGCCNWMLVLCELPDSKDTKGNRMGYGIGRKPPPASSQEGRSPRRVVMACCFRTECTLRNVAISLVC